MVFLYLKKYYDIREDSATRLIKMIKKVRKIESCSYDKKDIIFRIRKMRFVKAIKFLGKLL